MSEAIRTSSPVTRQTIVIPPLYIRQSHIKETSLPRSPAKDPFAFIKESMLDDDSNFLKEKSLYRYTISRKLSRGSHNKSQSSLLLPEKVKRHRTEMTMEITPNRTQPVENKEKSLVSNISKENQPKSRYFRRKSRYQSQIGFHDFSTTQYKDSSVISQSQYFKNGETGAKRASVLKFDQIVQQNDVSALTKEIAKLKKQLQKERSQNLTLKIQLKQKYRQLEQKNVQNMMLRSQNQKLVLDKRRSHPIHNQLFILDHKLENQLHIKDQLIKQLQEKIKYIELENFTLNKTKKEKSKQANLITRLENRNRSLEDRVTILAKLKTKRNSLKGSIISQCSEISLNLSAEQDQEDCKVFEPLKTLQWASTCCRELDEDIYEGSGKGDRTQLSPWWQPKVKI